MDGFILGYLFLQVGTKKHPFALEIQHRGPLPTSTRLQRVAELEANDSLVCLCPR